MHKSPRDRGLPNTTHQTCWRFNAHLPGVTCSPPSPLLLSIFGPRCLSRRMQRILPRKAVGSQNLEPRLRNLCFQSSLSWAPPPGPELSVVASQDPTNLDQKERCSFASCCAGTGGIRASAQPSGPSRKGHDPNNLAKWRAVGSPLARHGLVAFSHRSASLKS